MSEPVNAVLDGDPTLRLIWQSLVRLDEKIGVKSAAPIYMNLTDAAHRCSVSRSTMYELIALPSSPGVVEIGAKRLLHIAAWDEYIAHFDNAREGINA